jgi:DNA-binding NtrC family response regulator
MCQTDEAARAKGAAMPSVLIVDDDASVVSALEAFLSHERFAVCTASHSAAALGQVLDAKPDVVLLDLRMPTVHGLEILQLMRTAIPNLQVIIVSAFLNDDIRQRAFDRGAYACLDKPVNLVELKTCITQALGSGDPMGTSSL